MNDDFLIDALRTEQQLARPEFSAALHRRLAAAIDDELRRRRRSWALAACVALVAAFALRNAGPTSEELPRVAVAAPAFSAQPSAGVEVLLQRSDRAAAELRQRIDLPEWASARELVSTELTRAVINRLPVGKLPRSAPKQDNSSAPPAQQPQASA